MDISNITASARTVDIKHPATGVPIGLKITLLPDSDEKVQSAKRKCLNERMQRRGKVTAELMEAQAFAVTLATAAGWEWEGEATFHGEKPDFSEANLRKVLKELDWIKDQLLEEKGDDAAFFSELTDEIAECARLLIRYDTKDEKGETRRQRNAKFGQPSPEIQVPEAVAHVWEWFWDLSARRKTGPEALTYAEVGEWQRLTGISIRPEEVAMLMSMDDAFLVECREEQAMARERARDKGAKK